MFGTGRPNPTNRQDARGTLCIFWGGIRHGQVLWMEKPLPILETVRGDLNSYRREVYRAAKWIMHIPPKDQYVSAVVYNAPGVNEPIRNVQVLGYAIGEGLVPIEWVALCGMPLDAEKWGQR